MPDELRDSNPPHLEATVESCQALLSWTASALLSEAISDKAAKEINNTISKMLTSIKVREGLNEMDELRAMTAKNVKASERSLENEASDRYTQEDISHSYVMKR